MSVLDYFKRVEKVDTSRSISPSGSEDSSKRKRASEEEGEEGGKRRSEEPLVRVKKPFVDETFLDDVLTEKQNIVQNIVQNLSIDGNANGGANNNEVIDISDDGVEEVTKEVDRLPLGEKAKCKELILKKVAVNVKKIKDIQKEVERERREREAREDAEAEANFSGDDEAEEAYEVEEILEYAFCKVDQVGKYFVKWVGWPSDTNTWEPEANLECTDLLVEFYKTRVRERESMTPVEKRAHQLPPDPRETFQVRLDFLKELGAVPGRRELEAMWRRDRRLPKQKQMKPLPEKMLNAAIDQVARVKTPSAPQVERIKELVKVREFFRVRTDQLHDLAKYETEINNIDRCARVQVINDVDLEGPPRQCKYINAYQAAEGIVIPNDPPVGCECDTCGLKQDARGDAEGCCSGAMGFMFAYTKWSKLRVEVGNPIYECNKCCACGPECCNRVVQKGRKYKLGIYRTDNGCGWGVKAMESIKAGSFVVEYVGEMITSEEAEERGKKYDAEGRTYLFDLDFNLGDRNPYTVDAAYYGNLSRFINHSCDPNLNIFNVYIDCLDPNMPRLCLFAKREIKKGEQITFDYRQSTGNADSKNTVKAHADMISSPTKKLAILQEAGLAETEEDLTQSVCRCGAGNCRKMLF